MQGLRAAGDQPPDYFAACVNSDRCGRAAALLCGIERNCELQVAVLRGFLRQIGGRSRIQGKKQAKYEEWWTHWIV